VYDDSGDVVHGYRGLPGHDVGEASGPEEPQLIGHRLGGEHSIAYLSDIHRIFTGGVARVVAEATLKIYGVWPSEAPEKADHKVVNFRILVLASGTFAIGTGTFVVTGILGEVARDLSVSVGSAGYLITVFAVVYALGSPALVVATGDVERRRLLVAALCLFALANEAAAFAPSFFWLVGARVFAACGAAVLTPVAAAVAAELGHEGRSLSLVMGGLSVIWVFASGSKYNPRWTRARNLLGDLQRRPPCQKMGEYLGSRARAFSEVRG
jgi:Major Facilitator Superfamily